MSFEITKIDVTQIENLPPSGGSGQAINLDGGTPTSNYGGINNIDAGKV